MGRLIKWTFPLRLPNVLFATEGAKKNANDKCRKKAKPTKANSTQDTGHCTKKLCPAKEVNPIMARGLGFLFLILVFNRNINIYNILDLGKLKG